MKKCIIFIFALSVFASAQSGGQFEITKSVISSGGGTSSGGNFSLSGTFGQTVAEKSTGGNFDLNSGFWGGGSSSPTVNRTLFDYDGDGLSDFSVRRPSTGLWYILTGTAGYRVMEWGVSTDRVTPADYDGDGKTDMAVFRPRMEHGIFSIPVTRRLLTIVGEHMATWRSSGSRSRWKGGSGDIPAFQWHMVQAVF